MKRIFGALVCVSALGIASSAQADNYFGTLRLVQNATPSGTMRFLEGSSPPTFSLFASGDIKDIMLQAFYRKAKLNIGYAPTACPPGISGSCGTVNSVNVDSLNF